jgi:hypothetical protein
MSSPIATFPKLGLLNESQAAEALSVTVSALRGWRLRGGGPNFVKAGRLVRYRPADLDRWLDVRTVANTSETAIEGQA